MKKKSIVVGILLPMFFGCLGLFYSSTSAAIRMLIFCFVLAFMMVIITDSSMFIYPLLILQPFVILWNTHLINQQNAAIDNNESYSDDSAVNSATDMIIPSMICLLFACGITALIGQFTESNIFANNLNIFYLLLIIITVIISLLPQNNYNNI